MSDITLNRYLIEGTNAQRLLFTPDPTDQTTIGPGLFSLPIWYETDTGDIYIWDQNGAAWVLVVSGGGGGITQLTGDVTAGPGSGSQAATIANSAVTLAKIANAAANSKWLGSGAAGSGAAYTENAFGTGLSVSGTTLNLADTAVTPGSYTSADITVDQQGRITAASNGSGGSSKVVQIVNTQTGAVATGTTTVPLDDTIPQSTEGDQYMSLSITPTNSSNKLRIDVVAYCSVASTNRWGIAGLFQDSGSDAIAAFTNFQNLSTASMAMQFTHVMTAGTTSSTTFKLRMGPNTAGTMTFNGSNGSRLFGGVLVSSITITEYVP